ncbi:MAG: hypothetical protein KTR24_06660 [Saprospiraceae bacterium]|nr:hypothetical protein [Saprospiraceae bacterium]
MKNALLVVVLLMMGLGSAVGQEKPETNEKHKEPKLSMLINNGVKPDLYIDGKAYDADVFDLLDFDKISSVDVLKDEMAMQKYNAPRDVIVITSKKAYASGLVDPDALKEGSIKIQGNAAESLEPMIIIDGVVVPRDSIDHLSPDQIESIKVVKGEEATKKYNAPNGVIKVKTKKK